MFGIFSWVGDWVLENRLPFSIDLRGGALKGKLLGIAVQLLQQGAGGSSLGPESVLEQVKEHR